MTRYRGSELRDRVEEVTGRRISGEIVETDDASDFLRLAHGMVLHAGGTQFFISGEAREGRFGLDDQPKHWVKYAWDLRRAIRNILKLPFYEEFSTPFGPLMVRCFRRPEKESRILDLVAGDDRFMQGTTVSDGRGNSVRVLEIVPGRSLYVMLDSLEMDHERYYGEVLPGLWPRVRQAVAALGALHDAGEQHGDVRNDHIFIDPTTGVPRWIDFDYEANYADFDLWRVGNILTWVVGKGMHACQGPDVGKCTWSTDIGPDDALLAFRHRLANLRKKFPYITPSLNEILIRFSVGAPVVYDSIPQVVSDMDAVTL